MADGNDREGTTTVVVRTLGGDDGDRARVFKAVDEQLSGVAEGSGLWEQRGADVGLVAEAIRPPYSPETLTTLHENSDSLRQCVDAYVTNIDGFGHHLEPVVDFEAEDAVDQIRTMMEVEAAVRGSSDVPEFSDAEVEARLGKLRVAAAAEKVRINAFFNVCCPGSSFVALRRVTRADIEITGNGYWEVIRNKKGKVTQFAHMPSWSVSLLGMIKEPVEMEVEVFDGPYTLGKEKLNRKFRRFVQSDGGGGVTYFKQFGDPRVMSAATGKWYKNERDLAVSESPDVKTANEVIHFKITATRRTPYGVPRWIGNLLSVLGSRLAEEINYSYFENKSIPPLVITVSGGKLVSGGVEAIRGHIEKEIKGKKNFHKILVLEAESSSAAQMQPDNGRVRIEVKSLTDAHLKDALFQNYDERNMDKVGMSFRLPRIVRGDIRDFNRATSEAALDFCEEQVFGPERVDFDNLVRDMLRGLGFRYWKFTSNGIQQRNPAVMSKMIAEQTVSGALTPRDARRLAADHVFNVPLGNIDADWADQPLALTIAGFGIDDGLDGEIPEPEVGDGGVSKAWRRAMNHRARRLIRLRDAFRKAEEEEAAADLDAARDAEVRKGEPEVVRIALSDEQLGKIVSVSAPVSPRGDTPE